MRRLRQGRGVQRSPSRPRRTSVVWPPSATTRKTSPRRTSLPGPSTTCTRSAAPRSRRRGRRARLLERARSHPGRRRGRPPAPSLAAASLRAQPVAAGLLASAGTRPVPARTSSTSAAATASRTTMSRVDTVGIRSARRRQSRTLRLRQVRAHLALHALQGVVDGLGVAVQALADLLVGAAVEVQREDAALELGQRGAQAPDQRCSSSEEITWLTGSWTVGPGRTSSSVGSPSLALAGVWENDTYCVQRRVLVARRRLDRGDDLAGDAELGEVAEARLAVGAEVADRLVEADAAPPG